MKLVFLGPPGAGKGTQAKFCAQKYGIAHISTGDMLRAAVQEGSELGNKVRGIIDGGQLVPDDLIVQIIRERVSRADCAKGYLLDGFPRTVPQAEVLDRMLAENGAVLDKVVLFSLPMDALLSRLALRRSQESREDDSENTQKKRLKIYEEQTSPLIQYYRNKNQLVEVDASGTIEQVQWELAQSLV